MVILHDAAVWREVEKYATSRSTLAEFLSAASHLLKMPDLPVVMADDEVLAPLAADHDDAIEAFLNPLSEGEYEGGDPLGVNKENDEGPFYTSAFPKWHFQS